MADTETTVSDADFDAGISAVFEDAETKDVETTDTTETEETVEEVAEEAPASEESEETSEEAEETESEEGETTEEEEAEETDEDEQRKELARQAFMQRQADRERRQQAQKQAEQELLQSVKTDPETGQIDEQDLAVKQLQIDAYNNKVTANENTLKNSFDKAMNDIELFRSPTPAIAKALDKAIDSFQAKYVRVDSLGNPIQVDGDLYQYLTEEASIIQELTQLGARNEKTANAKQRVAVTPPPSSSPKEKKVDPLMAGINEAFKD